MDFVSRAEVLRLLRRQRQLELRDLQTPWFKMLMRGVRAQHQTRRAGQVAAKALTAPPEENPLVQFLASLLETITKNTNEQGKSLSVGKSTVEGVTMLEGGELKAGTTGTSTMTKIQLLEQQLDELRGLLDMQEGLSASSPVRRTPGGAVRRSLSRSPPTVGGPMEAVTMLEEEMVAQEEARPQSAPVKEQEQEREEGAVALAHDASQATATPDQVAAAASGAPPVRQDGRPSMVAVLAGAEGLKLKAPGGKKRRRRQPRIKKPAQTAAAAEASAAPRELGMKCPTSASAGAAGMMPDGRPSMVAVLAGAQDLKLRKAGGKAKGKGKGKKRATKPAAGGRGALLAGITAAAQKRSAKAAAAVAAGDAAAAGGVSTGGKQKGAKAKKKAKKPAGSLADQIAARARRMIVKRADKEQGGAAGAAGKEAGAADPENQPAPTRRAIAASRRKAASNSGGLQGMLKTALQQRFRSIRRTSAASDLSTVSDRFSDSSSFTASPVRAPITGRA